MGKQDKCVFVEQINRWSVGYHYLLLVTIYGDHLNTD